jgi:hypothetical protein
VGWKRTIGVAIADMSEFVAIDPAYGIGDQRAQVRSAVDHELAVGRLPDGLELELTFRDFSSTSIEHKREIADQFADDDVLAVIGARDFTYGSVRLAEVHGVPVIDVNAVNRSILARTAPWLFTIRAAQDLVYLTYIGWAHHTGRLAGRRIGVFSDRYTDVSTRVALERLRALGHEPSVHLTSDGVGVGSDHDREAAERFASAGVDLVMPFVSGSSLARVARELDRLGVRPTILELETGEHVTDVSGSVMPPALYEGSSAIAMSRVGEVAAGLPMAPAAADAIERYRSVTGVALEPTGRESSGALSNLLMATDLVSVLFAGLRAAGPGVDRGSLVRGIETIEAMPSASGGRLSYRAGEHWGCREMREIVWRSGAWRVVGEYAPMALG